MFDASSVLTKQESSKTDIQNYLYNRLPKGCGFSKSHIKVTEIWYDWNKRKEFKEKQTGCEKTRKITIERGTLSKVGEGFRAFFSSLTSIGESRYNLDDTDIDNISTALDELFSDQALGTDGNKTQMKKLYVSCKKVTFLVSLDNPNHFSGPSISEYKGIGVASTVGKVGNRIGTILQTIALIIGATRSRN